MVVIAKTALAKFSKDYPQASDALLKWYDIVKKSDWSNFSDLRQDFGSADAVGNDRYVFNIKGNNFRIVVLIIFKTRTVFILFVSFYY